MKFKNLLITAALAICVQMAPPAWAAPTGDWIDTSSMTPVYTAENLSVTASGAVEADVNITDFIIDFEVAMNGRYVVRRNIDGTVKNWIDIRQSWATEAREGSTTQGTGRHVQQVVNANGWFDRTNVDPDYPLYTTENIGFRLQTKNGTISLWAADLDAEGEPAYKYAGIFLLWGVYKPKTIYYIIHIKKNENRKKFFIYNYKERKCFIHIFFFNKC